MRKPPRHGKAQAVKGTVSASSRPSAKRRVGDKRMTGKVGGSGAKRRVNAGRTNAR